MLPPTPEQRALQFPPVKHARCRTSTGEDGALAPHHSSDHPPPPPRGLASHPDLDAPPVWAQLGPCPRLSQNYIPPWARVVSPGELSSVPQDQASSPGGFTALGLEKKRAAGMDKLKLGPPAALHPLPAFLIISRAAAAHSSRPLSLPSSFHTDERAQRLAQPCKSGAFSEVKIPLQQAVRTAWPGAWPSLWAPAGISHAACCTVVPPDLVSASLPTFLLLAPPNSQTHLTQSSPPNSALRP